MVSIHLPSDPLGVLVYLIGLVILWVVVSVPVYFAARAVKGKDTSLGNAMAATLGGVIVYYIVYLVVAFFLGAVIGASAGIFALILGFIAWLAVFRGTFRTSWVGAVGIVVLAWLILLVLDFILVAAFGVKFPDFFPF